MRLPQKRFVEKADARSAAKRMQEGGLQTPPRESRWNKEELTLLERAKNGDNQARTELLMQARRAISRVFKSFYQLTPEDREDLLQEANIRLLKALPGYRPEAKFSTFAATVARNLARAHVTRNRPWVSFGSKEATNAVDFRTEMLFRERRAQEPPDIYENAMQAMENIPEPYRQVVKAYYVKDEDPPSYAEMSVKLKIPIGTVRSRLSRGVAHLRKILGVRKVMLRST